MFSIHRSLFTLCSLFAVHRKRITDHVRKVVNRKWLMAFLTLFALSSSQIVGASSTSKTPVGITLSPAVVQASISSTESEHRVDFKITNNTSAIQTLGISTADFNTLGETEGLVFMGANPTQLEKKYGLATWMTLPQTSITLTPKQTSTISAVITNSDTLEPGGHYGALMLAIDEGGSSTSPNKVAVHPIASSLLFVNKIGGDSHKLRLTNIYSSHNIFSLPNSVTLRFYNDGNTHLIPRGTVEIADPRGKLVSKGVINEDSNLILPETYRRFSVPLNKVGSSIVPGKYKITTNFRFDGYDQFRGYQSSQFLLTPVLLLVVLGIILVAALVVGFLLLNKDFVKKHLTRIKKPAKKSR